MKLNRLALFMLVVIVHAMSLAILGNGARTGELDETRKAISKLGIGPKSRVEVKTTDGRKLKGYISEINETGFVVVDKEGNETAIAYVQTRQVSRRTKTIIGIIAGVTVVVIVAIFASKST